MSTAKGKNRFAGLGVRKNERPEEVPATILTESVNMENNINANTENNISVDTINNKNINTEINIERNTQNFNDENIPAEPRGRKKSNKASFKSVTFNVEQNLHRDFKIMAANLGVSMVDMLDEALRLYIEIRNREDFSQEFESGKTVTDIVFEVLPESSQ